jgi:hypothetical protein
MPPRVLARDELIALVERIMRVETADEVEEDRLIDLFALRHERPSRRQAPAALARTLLDMNVAGFRTAALEAPSADDARTRLRSIAWRELACGASVHELAAAVEGLRSEVSEGLEDELT